MIRVGVVGCGNIGSVHGAVLKEMEGIRLAAFADSEKGRAPAYSDRFTDGAANAYGSIEDMLFREKLDVVHICTPHDCHVPQAVLALQRGISVFMEKPPAISQEQFEKLSEAERVSEGKLGICFQNRFNQTTERVNRILQEGRLGKLLGGRAFVTWRREAPYYTESGWRGRLKREGGGALINQSIHTLDLLLLWLGRPLWVEASMRNHHLKGIVEVEDTMEAFLVFSEGERPVTASFYATTAYCRDAPVLIELACERGMIRLEGDSVWCREADQEPEVWKASAKTVLGKDYWGEGHEACIRAFYESIMTGEAYANDLDSCKLTFQTMMQLYESAGKKERN